MSQVILWFWYLFLVWFVSFCGTHRLVLAAEMTPSDSQMSVSTEKSQKKANSENESREEVPPVAAVVSATRREIPIEKTTRFVTVITHEEIERSGKVYVIDLLRSMPGVSVTQSGAAGRTSSVFLRGTNANQTLVLLDDVQINGPTTGEATLEHMTTDNIERIEILRGPQSVLYGADALGGLIHIITKSGKVRGIHGDGNFEFGSHETFREQGSLSGLWKQFSFSGAGGRFDTHGLSQNDGNENTTARGHGKIQVTEHSNLDVAFHYDNAIVGIEDGTFLQDPNRSNRSRTQVLNAKYTASLKEWWEQSVKYSFFHDALRDFDPRDPGAGGTDPESKFKLDTDRHTLEYQTSFFVRDFDVLTLGYEFEHTESTIKRPQIDGGGFDALLRNHGWFAQNELTLWKIWTIVGGVRIDHFNLFGTEESPLVSSGLWITKTMTKIKGSFGRAFKAPTLNELFFPGFGNRNIQPEKSWGWDVGVEQFYWNKKGSVSAAYFHNSIRDLIQFVNAASMAENVARATTQGVELEQKISPCEHLTFYTNYTYTDAVDDSTGKRLTRRPKHEGKLGLLLDVWRFHFSSDWILMGNSEDTSSGRRLKVKGYTRLDMTLAFDVTRFFQIYGRAEDLNNDYYTEVRGFETPTARFYVGSKARF